MAGVAERHDVIDRFGEEWTRFDQQSLDEQEARDTFEGYFEVFPWDRLPPDAEGFDLGGGSGRWARFVAPRVGTLHLIEPSHAIEVAQRNLADAPNVVFHQATAQEMPLPEASMDFGYSLGVLHHVADTEGALAAAVRALKPGAPFLVYLYYALDNRPAWFRALWQASDLGRRVISQSPRPVRLALCDMVAASVYLPLARGAALAERAGAQVESWPLSAYRHRSFYTMRTDALDRLGTRLEKRYTHAQVTDLLTAAGLTDIRFCSSVFWCAVGTKRK